ncbi:protein translocase SEC61 complex subunit gamma [Candidatus Pacearchaeota archaeon]|nr:protein translocase SEC61 complex subunit gamma [Candidatus Pacearchaeota archaeon]
MKFDLQSFGRKCLRVWRVLRKPSKEEFIMVAKVSAVGILAVGLVGFIIGILMGFVI